MRSRVKASALTNRHDVAIRVQKPRKYVDYEEVAELLKTYDVILHKIDRRVAWYAKNRLSGMLGKKVVCMPATNRLTDEHVYIFSVSDED